ncbi:5'-deoxyadenosine deaminase [bioreactor metagenome]|uniref:5'-deoxyadenosine deaminase n=1 Tax=bioreactor metagenome TaxID=1076179 RepID=A0A645ANJ0_9ZZZZ
MATAGGAALQGIDAGVLDEGKLADLAVVDLTAGNLLFDGEDLVTLLVYCLRGENVESVMVDGRFLMEGRRIPGIDEAAVLQELRSGMKRLG